MAGDKRRGVGRPVGGESTRAEVLRVARMVFAEHGYAGASLRGVAVAAGVDPSTVVHFFATKQGLFRAAVEDAMPALEATVDGLVHGASGSTIVQNYLGAFDDPDSGPALVALLRTSAGSADASGVVDAVLLQRVAARAESRHRLGVELAMAELVGLAVARHLARMPELATTPIETLAELAGPRLDDLLTLNAHEADHATSSRRQETR